ncbi:hypothetical protein BROSI_A1279 [Candidatus Brocadia sinica JPN1]|uniref:Uncharacterized protein n=1 Tax=Candidatus Brocadia sinica JPN1 TaxID=1197129 RepID=A0ABQ0JVF7_9BACT|nr:hypothetical protein BROSI_A1279 [Candidatus Brocadia sinica JPN1]
MDFKRQKPNNFFGRIVEDFLELRRTVLRNRFYLNRQKKK